MPINLCIISGCFCGIKAELRSCDSDYVARNMENILWFGLLEKQYTNPYSKFYEDRASN